MGYLTVPTDHLNGLLKYPDAIEARNFVPRTVPMRFDAEVMPDIDRWVRRRARRMLFVNGAQDPSGAEPFRPGPRDARVVCVAGDLPLARPDRADRGAHVLSAW
ncbi:hypothetical protein ACFWIA_01495 [Streptomyces sp. NPDC127068]|uniref:hypothetical protein n=1 Tax=Streptomyces sp. NPDC127068 TaxID=3347127 RepID=UPI00365F87B4